MPADTRLDLDAFSSDITVTDVTADIKAHTFSGKIDLDVSRASAYPDISRRDLQRRHHDARARPAATARSTSTPSAATCAAILPLTVHGTSQRNMTAELGSGGGATLEFKTFSGDLRVVR